MKGKGKAKATSKKKGKAAAKASATATGRAKTTARRQPKGAAPQAKGRDGSRRRRIDVVLKGLAVAAEPPIDSDPAHLDAVFRSKLQTALAALAARGTPFRLVEGFRTRARQQWLFGSGRPKVVPFGRPGPVLTNADGMTAISRHQGSGAVGSGKAVDCYPTREGRVFIPPSSSPVWAAYADAVEAVGLVAGHRFPTFKDSPHCELR